MNLFDHIDRPTFEAACARLGITPGTFWKLSGGDFGKLIDTYLKECQQYIARLNARQDQMEAAYRITASVPEGYTGPLYDLAQRGVIDPDDFRDAMHTLVRVQAEEDDDPNPADENVAALLTAMQTCFGGGG